MKQLNLLYKQLVNFLNLKKQDRQEVVSWYDELSQDILIDEVEQVRLRKKVKSRLLASIKKDTSKVVIKRIYRWTAAAAVLLVGGYALTNYLDKSEIATIDQLANVEPAKERAIIILEDGTEIDLDKLGLNQSVQIEQTIIKKDDKGRVSYHNLATGKETQQSNSLYVPAASIYQLTLVDGTRVTLNSDSKLTYPSTFGEGDRIVKLDGEGYFEVTKTSNKSKFIVEANSQKIEVLGTKFNVKSYKKENRDLTTLEEGSVQVNTANKYTILQPSQQVISKETSFEKKTIDIEEVLSWTKGQFYFDGTNTEEVLRDIARWYNITIDYEPRVGGVQYKGKIPRNLPLNKLIELLNYAELKTQSTIDNNKKIHLIIT